MPKWLQKLFVSLVTVLTLGTVVPTVNYSHSDSKPSKQDISSPSSESSTETYTADAVDAAKDVAEVGLEEDELEDGQPSLFSRYETIDEIVARLETRAVEEATVQGFEKFGETIAQEIGDSYTKEIIPAFGDVVASIGKETDEETLRNLAISHNPSAGKGERILNVYDMRTGKELIKFHVRRDHPPLDGYWFNFHYHTYQDNFQNHHHIGSIYWDKNMPPNWMANA